ncbi:MAG TPA: M1 family metallopeptidase [Verrucomicrobiae bacterium]|nr:M1 family metallopeptidase [Verrucomicrobiae bacterium]
MFRFGMRRCLTPLILVLLGSAASVWGQGAPRILAEPTGAHSLPAAFASRLDFPAAGRAGGDPGAATQDSEANAAPTRAEILRGAYGPYRENNDLLSYDLDVRVDPDKQTISGKNSIRFKMLQDGTRIQLDLHPALQIEKILWGGTPLEYVRDSGAVFIDFPETLRAGQEYTIDFYYSGHPEHTGRFGGFTFGKDPRGRPWIYTACEDVGASVWWPNKDQWRDEVENMRISVEAPNGLVDVSNGKFMGKTDLGDGYTRWDWMVHYPINNYDVALNIGDYVHFSDHYGDLSLDYYVLPEDLEKAKKQFTQVKGMLEAYEHYFGEYPFPEDGYKLVEVPYAGMEHQSAVAYGNHFTNGYYGRDWTGVGVSPKFDFIIIHESGHEWFGNSVSAADRSDMWIHEGWTTYLECLYVEYTFGYEDALKYVNGYKAMVRNLEPVIAERGIAATPPEDMYFKGALFLNTLRNVVNDDARWWKLIHDFYQHFKYQNIMTEDVVEYFNRQTGMFLTPLFDQYLRHTAIPTLELKFDEAAGTVAYRWKADEPDFAMPVRVGKKGDWEIIQGTTYWQTMKTPLKKDKFDVATDLYYIDVVKE